MSLSIAMGAEDLQSCIIYAVLASLLHATYDGGEWIPGFVIVLKIVLSLDSS